MVHEKVSGLSLRQKAVDVYIDILRDSTVLSKREKKKKIREATRWLRKVTLEEVKRKK